MTAWHNIIWLLSFIPHKRFQYVTRYTLFECKWLFSIYIHHIESGTQSCFHTHAFNAVAIILHGGYSESQKRRMGRWAPTTHHVFQAPTIRLIPRLMNHKFLSALPHTVSLLITGPYADMWTEETEVEFRLITSGHREIFRVTV